MKYLEESNRKKRLKIVTKKLSLSDKSLVTKSNQLIEARYKLSLDEQRMVLLVVSQIEPDDEGFTFYRLASAEMIKALGWENDTSAYTRLRAIVRRLQTRLVFIKTVDGNDLEAQWFGATEYEKGSPSPGMIEFEISRKLLPYLLQLKGHFTSYKLKNIFRLQSAHTIRIYELLKQYEKIGERRMGLKELKLSLGIEKLKTYRLYGNIKEKIMLRAQKELLEKTDISFSFEEIKEGRKVTALRFIIKRNDEKGDLFPAPVNTRMPSAVKQMVQAGMVERQAEKIWRNQWEYLEDGARQAVGLTDDYDFSKYLLEKLALLRGALKKGDVPNPGGWLSNAIKENWTIAKNVRMKKPSAKRSGGGHSIGELFEERQTEKKETLSERSRAVQLDSEYMGLSPARQKAINKKVIKSLLASDDLVSYRNDTTRIAEEHEFGTGIYTNLPAGLRVIATTARRELMATTASK